MNTPNQLISEFGGEKEGRSVQADIFSLPILTLFLHRYLMLLSEGGTKLIKFHDFEGYFQIPEFSRFP